MNHYLEFESKIADLQSKITTLQEGNDSSNAINLDQEISGLTSKYNKLLKEIYSNLTAWQKVQVARHPNRPHFLDYVEHMVTNFIPLSGDRLYAEDSSIVGGFCNFNGKTILLLGVEKGNDLESRIKHNFGMPKPDGYRKAQRLMELADRLEIPVITLVDTPGAYPGKEAEERGQGEAIAKTTATCLKISTPLISIIIGEGGSGGAVALASGDYVMMLENSVYSVISPEGCASILWRDEKMAYEAAEHLKLTAQDLKKLKVINEIIEEPIGGAHRNKQETINNVKHAIENALKSLQNLSKKERKLIKQKRYLDLGKAKV